MLLYDHVREHAENMLRRYGEEVFGDMNCGNLSSLRKAVVYDASDVVPLFSDWSRDKDKPIPKTPPHDVTWVEWKYRDASEDGQYYDDWTLGVLIGPMSAESKAYLLANPPETMSNGGASAAEFLSQDKDFYFVQMFKRLEGFKLNPNLEPLSGQPRLSLKEREDIHRRILWKPAADLGTFIWSHFPDGSGVHRFKIFPTPNPGESEESFGRRISIFFLDVSGAFGVPYWQCGDPWPAFMAFSLLHCKNVVTEDHVPDAKLQRRVARAGNPPRVTYKTLTIEVPASVQRHGTYDGDEDDAGPKVRFHLCSGHFKHLTSERYKAKRGQWIWCPAHFKGSKELGEVHKRYALTPKPEEPQP